VVLRMAPEVPSPRRSKRERERERERMREKEIYVATGRQRDVQNKIN
jgi:hypothetical protein